MNVASILGGAAKQTANYANELSAAADAFRSIAGKFGGRAGLDVAEKTKLLGEAKQTLATLEDIGKAKTLTSHQAQAVSELKKMVGALEGDIAAAAKPGAWSAANGANKAASAAKTWDDLAGKLKELGPRYANRGTLDVPGKEAMLKETTERLGELNSLKKYGELTEQQAAVGKRLEDMRTQLDGEIKAAKPKQPEKKGPVGTTELGLIDRIQDKLDKATLVTGTAAAASTLTGVGAVVGVPTEIATDVANVVSAVVDVGQAIGSAVQGNGGEAVSQLKDAGLRAVSAIPYVGKLALAAKVAKGAKVVAEVAEGAQKLDKAAETATSAAKTAEQVAEKVGEKVAGKVEAPPAAPPPAPAAPAAPPKPAAPKTYSWDSHSVDALKREVTANELGNPERAASAARELSKRFLTFRQWDDAMDPRIAAKLEKEFSTKAKELAAKATAKEADEAARAAKLATEGAPMLRVSAAEKAGTEALKAGKLAEASQSFATAAKEGFDQLALAGGGKLLNVSGKEVVFPHGLRLHPPPGFETAFTNSMRAGNTADALKAAEQGLKKVMDLTNPMQERLARGHFARQLADDALLQAKKFADAGQPELSKRALAVAEAMVEKMKPYVQAEKTEMEAIKWADAQRRALSQFRETGHVYL